MTLSPRKNGNSSSIVSSSSSDNDDLSRRHTFQFLSGLILAGMASTLLTTIFGLFHVDIFLRVYELPLATYATGNFIFSFINTANDVAGAWMVDVFASKSSSSSSSRSSIIGVSGVIFCICFLSPFFRWHISDQGSNNNSSSSVLRSGGLHFVTSMSLYDTMYSFMAILMGSVITDNSFMSDQARVYFMASGKVVNLVASMIVARVGLGIFEDNMQSFQRFVIVVAMLTAILFVLSQWMMNPTNIFHFFHKKCRWYNHRLQQQHSSSSMTVSPNNGGGDFVHDDDDRIKKPMKRQLRLRQVIRDFWTHDNFRAWIGMEMLLECQHNFVSSFLKTFIDRLIVANNDTTTTAAAVGLSRPAADWFLSLLHPLKQIAGILCYAFIRRMGYHKMYTFMFRANIILCLLTLMLASPLSPYMIGCFVLVHTIMTGAVQSAGFHLAMSDMVLEMKRIHASEGRLDEPSLAGLFMGANALLCKPMESVLPIVAAYFLGRTDFSTNDTSPEANWVLFYLLVVPPLLCSCLQLWSWQRYNLHPERTNRMRHELRKLTESIVDSSSSEHGSTVVVSATVT